MTDLADKIERLSAAATRHENNVDKLIEGEHALNGALRDHLPAIIAALKAAETPLGDVAGLVERRGSYVLTDNLRVKLGGVSIPAMQGDNLSITLASHFENPDQEEEDNGWTPDAIAGCDATLDAIHALYAPVLDEKIDAITALTCQLANYPDPDMYQAVSEDYARVLDQLAERDAEVARLRGALHNLHERIADAWPELRHLPPMVEARQALGGDNG